MTALTCSQPVVIYYRKRRTTAGQVSRTTPDARRTATFDYDQSTKHAILIKVFTCGQKHEKITDGDHDDHPIKAAISKPSNNKQNRDHLSPRRVGGDGRDVLDSADTHPCTGERTERALCTGAGRFRTGSASGPEFDVKRSDTDFTAACGDILSSQHGGVWRRLVTICLDLHSTFGRKRVRGSLTR